MNRADRRISPHRVVLLAAAIVALLVVVAGVTRASGGEVLAFGMIAVLLLGLIGLGAIGVLAVHRWLQRRGRA